MTELAYSVLLNHKFPSWLYSVDQGATTIWERWNSYTKEKGFGPVDMNSFNHYAYGAVAGWIYKHAAGISSAKGGEGYKIVQLKPLPDARLGSLRATYRTPHGLVKSAWRYEGKKWTWSFTIPEGVKSRVVNPFTHEEKAYPAGDHEIVCTVK